MIKTYMPRTDARVEAMLFTAESLQMALEWAGDRVKWSSYAKIEHGVWQVRTLEGWVDIPFGHYLIKGTHGEFYPCAPEVFEARWQEAE